MEEGTTKVSGLKRTLARVMRARVIVSLAMVLAVGVGSHFAFVRVARTSPMWRYAERALAKTAPDYDLRYCVDLEAKDRKDFSNTKWKPLPCINTATSNYRADFRAGNCARFVQNPARWGFHEVEACEAVPGDLIVFFKKNGWARHAAVYTQNSLLGPFCATTAYPGGGYYRYFPYKICLWVTRLFGSFSSYKYYRYGTMP